MEKMKILIPILAICLLSRHAEAWGGLFNRFSPEMLANMGYGGQGGFIQVIYTFSLNICQTKYIRYVYVFFNVKYFS